MTFINNQREQKFGSVFCKEGRGEGKLYISVQNVLQEQLLEEWEQLSKCQVSRYLGSLVSLENCNCGSEWELRVSPLPRTIFSVELGGAQERGTHFYGFPLLSSFPVHLRHDPIFVLPPGGHRLPEHELHSHAITLQEGPSLTPGPETPKPVQKG